MSVYDKQPVGDENTPHVPAHLEPKRIAASCVHGSSIDALIDPCENLVDENGSFAARKEIEGPCASESAVRFSQPRVSFCLVAELIGSAGFQAGDAGKPIGFLARQALVLQPPT